MNPKELVEILEKLDIGDADFAELLDVTTTCVKYWITGHRKIPPTAAKLARFFLKHPELMSEF